jgi:hypothetical protein
MLNYYLPFNTSLACLLEHSIQTPVVKTIVITLQEETWQFAQDQIDLNIYHIRARQPWPVSPVKYDTVHEATRRQADAIHELVIDFSDVGQISVSATCSVLL